MADLNEVRIIGRLTRDPELRSTQSGQYICNFGIATGKKYKGQDGETTFVDITCWARLAEVAGKYLRKGKLVFIGGRLKLDTWDDRQTGQKRSKLSVVAENIQFLDRTDNAQSPNSDYVQNMQPPQIPTQNDYSWDEPDMGEPPF